MSAAESSERTVRDLGRLLAHAHFRLDLAGHPPAPAHLPWHEWREL